MRRPTRRLSRDIEGDRAKREQEAPVHLSTIVAVNPPGGGEKADNCCS